MAIIKPGSHKHIHFSF